MKRSIALLLLITLLIASLFAEKDRLAGKVNGQPIKEKDFIQSLRGHFESKMLETNKSIDQVEWEKIYNTTWADIIKHIVLTQHFNKHSITVTQQEVVDTLLTNIPASVKDAAVFETEGEFDITKYNSSLTSDKPADLTWLRNYYYQYYIPLKKLEKIMISSMPIKTNLLKQEHRYQYGKADVDIVYVPYSNFTPSVSQQEIVSYYNSHQYSFISQPVCDLQYLIAPIVPSKEDTLTAKTTIDSLYYALQNGADFVDLVRNYSMSDSATKDGEMNFKEFSSLPAGIQTSLRNLNAQGVTRPLKRGSSWVILKPIDQTKTMIKWRELAITPRASEQTKQDLLLQLVRIRELSDEMSFQSAASEYNYKTYSAVDRTPKKTWLPNLGKSPSIITRALDRKPGFRFEPIYYKDIDSYVLFEVTRATPYQVKPLIAVTDSIKDIITLQKQTQMATDAATSFCKTAGRNWQKSFTENKFELSHAIISKGSSILYENNESVLRSIMENAKPKSWSTPQTLSKGVALVYVRDLSFDNPDWKQYTPTLRAEIQKRTGAAYFQTWLQEQFDNAKFIDYKIFDKSEQLSTPVNNKQ